MAVQLIQKPAARAFVDLTVAVPQVMAAVKRTSGEYIYANDGFCHRLGRSQHEILGRSLHELFPSDLADSYAAQDQHVITTHAPIKGVLELIVRSDGTLGWYVTSKVPLADDHDPCFAIAVLSIDLHSQMTSTHAGLAAALSAIREDVGHPWRMSELAERAGLSQKQLQRLCKKTLGISPQQLVQRLRLEEAVRLATTTKLSLGDIAAECGFYDQASFTRQFRNTLGLTPSVYRRSETVTT